MEAPERPDAPPRRSRRLIKIFLAVLFVAGMMAILLTTREETEGTATGIVFEAFDGDGPVAMAEFRGRPLVLNFWASWCEPCIEEMPDFQTVYSEVGDRVAFLGVNVMDGERRAREVAERTGVTYPLARDETGDVLRSLDAIGMPTTFFVDPSGRIVERFTGPLDVDRLRERIRRHFDV